MTNRIEKRCMRCGTVALVRARQRRCHRRQFGVGSYCCWGKLERVVAAPKPRKERRVERPQDVARKELQRVRSRIASRINEIAEAARTLRELQATAERLEREASMTDAEVEERRALRAAAAKKANESRRVRRRGIELEARP